MSQSVSTLLGEYLIVACTVPAASRWAGYFKINRFAEDGTRSLVFEDEEELDTTCEAGAQPLGAARIAAEAHSGRLDKKPGWDQ